MELIVPKNELKTAPGWETNTKGNLHYCRHSLSGRRYWSFTVRLYRRPLSSPHSLRSTLISLLQQKHGIDIKSSAQALEKGRDGLSVRNTSFCMTIDPNFFVWLEPKMPEVIYWFIITWLSELAVDEQGNELVHWRQRMPKLKLFYNY